MLSTADSIVLCVSLHQLALRQLKHAGSGLAEQLGKRASEDSQSLLDVGEPHNQLVALLPRCKELASRIRTVLKKPGEALRLENKA
jgi:hypothetical protein